MSGSESSATNNLELMPRGVRDKLDRVGLKMHLKDWQACSLAERQQLCDLPCATDDEVARYAVRVDDLVRRLSGKPAERMGPSHKT
jgi:hypothetical protein